MCLKNALATEDYFGQAELGEGRLSQAARLSEVVEEAVI